MSRRGRWLALVVSVAFALPLVGMLWLLSSGGGRDWSLSQLIAQLPEDALSVGSAEGRLMGPLVLRDVHYQGDGFALHVDVLRLDHAVSALLTRRLSIHSLHLEQLAVTLVEVSADSAPTRVQLPEQIPWPSLDLPLAVEIAELRVDRISVVQAARELAPPSALLARHLNIGSGELSIDSLRLGNAKGELAVRGTLGLAGKIRADLSADWISDDQRSPNLSLRIKDVDGRLVVSSVAEEIGQLTLRVDSAMQWGLDAAIDVADTQRWLADSPSHAIALTLSAAGDAQSTELSGSLNLDGQIILVERVVLSLLDDGAAMALDALRVTGADLGAVNATGRVDFSEPLQLELRAELDALRLPPGQLAEGDATAVAPTRKSDAALLDAALLDGVLSLSGAPSALVVELTEGRIRRGELSADVELAGQLLESSFRLDQLAVRNQQSELTASGMVGWEPALNGALAVTLRDFDPSLLLADMTGRISGQLRLAGTQAEPSPELRVEIVSLSGEFRDRPLSGAGTLRLDAGGGEANLALSLGTSRLLVTGNPGEQLDLRVQLTPLALADLLPDANGTLSADLRLQGDRQAPRVVGTVSASSVLIEGVAIEGAQLSFDGSWSEAAAPASTSILNLEAEQIDIGDVRLDTVAVQLAGVRSRHTLSARITSERANLQLAAGGSLGTGGWTGSVDSLQVGIGDAESLRLRAPVALSKRGDAITFDRFCLHSTLASEVCAEAKGDAASQSLAVQISKLDLDGLAKAFGAQDVAIEGVAEASMDLLRRAGKSPEGRVSIRLPEGMLKQPDMDERALLRWSGLLLEGNLTADALTARVQGQLNESGRIEGEISGASPFDTPDAAVQGSLSLQLPDVSALELALPDLANLGGVLASSLRLSGTWSAPLLDGSIELDALAAELPALGIRLRDSNLRVRGDGNTLALEGALDTGGGVLRLEGTLFDLGGTPTGSLQLRGESVHVANTPSVSARVSPDLLLRYRNSSVNVTGTVGVPQAAIAIDALEGSVQPSDDVVVLDPREGDSVAGAIGLRARVEVVLGDKVTLKGFGFDGGISGTLQVNERSGRAATGRGTLTLRGKYQAYGQDLEIIRGRLLFASSPLDDPGIEVRAQREVGDVKVGIEVAGSARRPQLSVWSDPALDQAEALSYLVLGQPLRSASAAEGAQLGQAAAAFGGNYLAKQLGARLGFDTFGVADSQSLGGAAFTVGKYLSPALYLSYGVSLFGSGQIVTLRYLLSERFDIEIESGTESRAGLNYHIER